MRRTILIRDRWTCQYCGAPATTVDHKIPRARGGTDALDNLAACCRSCQYPDARPTLLRFADVPAESAAALTTSAAVRSRASGPSAAIRPILGEMTRRDPD